MWRNLRPTQGTLPQKILTGKKMVPLLPPSERKVHLEYALSVGVANTWVTNNLYIVSGINRL